MAYVLTDEEYEDFRQMRKLYLSGRNNSGTAGGASRSPSPAIRQGDTMGIICITGDEVGGETYSCSVYLPSSAFYSADSGNTAANAAGTLITSDAIFINLQGIGLSTHKLTHEDNNRQRFFVGMLIGVTEDSRPIYVGNAAWFDPC